MGWVIICLTTPIIYALYMLLRDRRRFRAYERGVIRESRRYVGRQQRVAPSEPRTIPKPSAVTPQQPKPAHAKSIFEHLKEK